MDQNGEPLEGRDFFEGEAQEETSDESSAKVQK
jgi:hypothetical protein